MKLTHRKLVDAACRWLQRQCSVVVSEIATTGEEPDALGWRGTLSILVECKASRQDFQADAKKFFRRFPEMGLGDHRYYCTPPGLITLAELPPSWGLLEWDGKRMHVVRKSEHFRESSHRQEKSVLLSLLRRIGQRTPRGVSIKAYTYATQNRSTLGIGMDAELDYSV